MKSAYELAMERLNQTSPTVKLTGPQKAAISDVESRYKAKVAEREIGLQDEIAKARATGNFEEAEKLQQQLADEKKKLQTELEEKKDAIRRGRATS